jgi:hypothetical protein
VADLPAAGAAEGTDLADAVGREIVVEHEALPRLPFQLLDALLVHLGAQRGDHERLGLAAREERRAVRARKRADLAGDGADVVEAAAVRTLVLLDDHVADVVLLQLVQHLAHQLARAGVRRFVLRDRLVAERVQGILPRVLLRRAVRLAGAIAVLGGDLLRQRLVALREREDALGLPDPFAQVVLHAVQLPDRLVRELQCLDDLALLHLAGARLHHHDVGVGGRDHQVERGLVQLGESGVQDHLPLDQPHADRGDRLGEGNVGDHERGRRAGDAEDVGVVQLVRAEDRAHDLDLVPVAVREERTERAVDEAAGEDLLLRRPPFPLEEAAGNAPRGVGLFPVFDAEREEVLLDRVLAGDRGAEHHGLAVLDPRGTRSLLGHLADLDAVRAAAKLKAY